MKKTTIICNKCDGKGHIEGFAHVSQGICFKCRGKGTISVSITSPTLARVFIDKYRQAGYFPEDQTGMAKVVCYGFQGHETAEQWMLKNCEYFYFGQPVCRSSMWYKVPVSEVSEFVNHFNKVTGANITLP